MNLERVFDWLKNILTNLPLSSMTDLRIVLPGSVAFIISFSLISLILLRANPRKTSVISPLSDEIIYTSSTDVLVVTNSAPSESPEPTSAPTPRPILPPATPRPSSTHKPFASPVSLEQLETWFTQYANSESINRDLLKKIAYCESKFNPAAVNGIYGGMYQFSSSTWMSTRRSMNMNTDPNLRFNAEEAIKTGAFRIATQGPAAWPNCK